MTNRVETKLEGDQPAAGAYNGDGGPDADHNVLLGSVLQKMQVMPRLFRLVFRQVAASSAGRDVEVGKIGSGHHQVLMVLNEEGPLRSGALAERCHMSEPYVSKTLKGIEASGLIERRTDPENRRVVWVSLTPKGRTFCEEMKAAIERALTEVLGPLSNRQLQDLITTFTHLEELVDTAERGAVQAGEDKR